jgi:hypothetical protein
LASRLKYLIAAFSCFLFLYGCEEDFTSTAISIDGKVINEDNFPVVNICAGTDPNTMCLTNNMGVFHLEIKSLPYNLFLNKSTVFSGLTILSPVIELPVYVGTGYTDVGVYLPDAGEGHYYIVRFISSQNFRSLQDDYVYNMALLRVFPETAESINGYIVVLKVEGDYFSNTITSYTGFGIKPMQLNSSDTTIYFEAEDLLYNPPDREMMVSLQGNNGMYTNNFINICFKGFTPSSNIIFELRHLSSSFTFVVPSELPLEYNFKIENNLPLYNGADKDKTVIIEKNENPLIQHLDNIELISPAENEVDIDENAELIFNSPLQIQTVNVFVVFSLKHYIEYYTTARSVRIKELIDAGFILDKNSELFWYVIQYHPFVNIDDMCSGNYLNRFTDKLHSEYHRFRTKP